MAENAIPQALINYRVYSDDGDLLGMADVELPELSAMTEEVKGAGIAGTMDTPILGHFDGMSLTINWITTNPNALKLAAPKAHQLDLRGSVQQYNHTTGEYETAPVKVVAKAIPKKTSLGKMAAGEKMDSPQEFEVLYLKATIKDEELLELDKLNYIFKVGDTDYLEKVRADLGLS